MNNKIVSKAIAELEQDLRAGNQSALDTFWERIKRESAPLIEESDEAGLYHVTYLYQGDDETENVLVLGGTVGINLEEAVMSRLLDTDLWYKTVKTTPTLPSAYYFSKNDTFGPDWQKRNQNFEMDKLNPHKATFLPNKDSGSEGSEHSLLYFASEVPSYVTEQEDVAKGNLTEYRVTSQSLNNERSVWVYTPPGYADDGERYGVLLVHDGFTYTTAVPTPTILDNLIAEGQLPPLVAVFVNCNQDRMKELACHDGYVDLIVRDVLPLVREKYHVTDDPAQVITAGSSLGGLISMYLGYKHPEVFGKVLSQSGSYWWGPELPEERGWLIKQFANTERLPLHIYMDTGLFESDAMNELAREMHQVLVGKGYDVHFASFAGGHDYPCWAKTIADGLVWLTGREDTAVK